MAYVIYVFVLSLKMLSYFRELILMFSFYKCCLFLWMVSYTCQGVIYNLFWHACTFTVWRFYYMAILTAWTYLLLWSFILISFRVLSHVAFRNWRHPNFIWSLIKKVVLVVTITNRIITCLLYTSGSAYFNYKNFHSIVLQGVVDACLLYTSRCV